MKYKLPKPIYNLLTSWLDSDDDNLANLYASLEANGATAEQVKFCQAFIAQHARLESWRRVYDNGQDAMREAIQTWRGALAVRGGWLPMSEIVFIEPTYDTTADAPAVVTAILCHTRTGTIIVSDPIEVMMLSTILNGNYPHLPAAPRPDNPFDAVEVDGDENEQDDDALCMCGHSRIDHDNDNASIGCYCCGCKKFDEKPEWTEL